MCANLKNHRLSHVKLKDYVCPMCGKDFAPGSSLVNHKHGKHSKIFPPMPEWVAKSTLDYTSR